METSRLNESNQIETLINSQTKPLTMSQINK